MKVIHPIFIFLFLWPSTAFSQLISGRVIDASTKSGVPFANVYINNTSLGVPTDTEGNFILKGPGKPGAYELVVSFVGYQTRKTAIYLSESNASLGIIELTPKKEELKAIEVVGKREASWERNFRKFKKAFLGNTDFARECEILNPWEVEFATEKEGVLIATANNPIQIQNHALGYLVFFDLTRFRIQGQSYLIEGHTRFTEQTSKDSIKSKRWKTNREITYRRSRQYLLRSIVQQRLQGEGFKLYRDKPGFENTTSRSAFFYQELGRFVIPMDTGLMVRHTKQKGIFSIRSNGNIEVHYTKAFARRKTYNDVPWLVGWVTIQDSLLVNEDGIELNPLTVNVSGYLNAERVANLLPLNYKSKPTVDINVVASGSDYENIYVHTDKPYYYPGETIWLAGYVKNKSSRPSDSLSKVARVELLTNNSRVSQRKLMAIDSGLFNGSFTLADTTAAGTFFLRAYTNFNRNFGDETLYTKYIPILPIKSKVQSSPKYVTSKDTTNVLRVRVDKKQYGLRDKVQVSIHLSVDSSEYLSADVSISVTDALQVAAVELEPQIPEAFAQAPPKARPTNPNRYETEQGIYFSGHYQSARSKTGEVLNIMRLNPPNYTSITTSTDGHFSIHDGLFYDSISYVIKSESKNKGTVQIDPYPEPTFHYARTIPGIDTVMATTVQRIIPSAYPDSSSLLLNTLVVKGRRVRAGLNENYKSTMGRPDYVLPAKDINTSYANLLLSIQGKIPGLIIRNANIPGEASQWQVYTVRGISMANPRQVLVTINDVPMSGPPGQILTTINPDMVESIEVTTRLNPLYGGTGDFTGAFGIVAVYTKTGAVENSGNNQTTQHESIIKIGGLSRPQIFQSPDYSKAPENTNNPDARSTLYWNPRVRVTNKKPGTINFYTSDMPGDYRVVIEGVLSTGEPVRSVSIIHVD